ncbi:hypothetical protein [Caldithrix abyssi]
MKNIILIMVLMFGVSIAAGQTIYLSDDFEDGDISNWKQIPDSNWTASTIAPITGNYSLKHALADTFGSSHITYPMDSIDVRHKNITWRFNLKNGSFDPTTAVKFWVYLMVHDTTAVNGYAVGVNLSGESDSLSLWRLTASQPDTLFLTTSFDWQPNSLVGIEVTRDSLGVWELKYDSNGNFDNLISAGAAKDDVYTAMNYFGMSFYFKTAEAGEIWLDDVLIQDASRVNVAIKSFLQGPFAADTMATDLLAQDFIPQNQPYNSSPWNYNGDEIVLNMPSNVVDWIQVQLRTATDSASTVATRSAFITKNGMITDLDGYSPVSFSGIADGNYYVVLRHRNHLAVMTANPLPLSVQTTLYDMTTGQDKAYGSLPLVELTTGVYGIPTGDANANGQVQNDDKNDFWNSQTGLAGYKSADFNVNGQVQNDDKNDYWKQNVGKGTYVPF